MLQIPGTLWWPLVLIGKIPGFGGFNHHSQVSRYSKYVICDDTWWYLMIFDDIWLWFKSLGPSKWTNPLDPPRPTTCPRPATSGSQTNLNGWSRKRSEKWKKWGSCDDYSVTCLLFFSSFLVVWDNNFGVPRKMEDIESPNILGFPVRNFGVQVKSFQAPKWKGTCTNQCTLPETNQLTPENWWLEDDIFSWGSAYFQELPLMEEIPNNHLGFIINTLVDVGINYQPQLVTAGIFLHQRSLTARSWKNGGWKKTTMTILSYWVLVIFRGYVKLQEGTLHGTNISPRMAFWRWCSFFPRWDMLIPWRVFVWQHGVLYFASPRSWRKSPPPRR